MWRASEGDDELGLGCSGRVAIFSVRMRVVVVGEWARKRRVLVIFEEEDIVGVCAVVQLEEKEKVLLYEYESAWT